MMTIGVRLGCLRAVPVVLAVWLFSVIGSADVAAQDALLEALLKNRQLVRTAEVIAEIGPWAEVYGPVTLTREREQLRRLTPGMPTLKLPRVEVPPLAARPEPVAEARPDQVASLVEIRWQRVAPEQEEEFMRRFAEVLWTGVRGRTAIDSMDTPEVRARLNSTFGPPTRSPVARARPRMASGSEFVQFEYWFVVNGTIPFVVMDRNGPFGRGAVVIADEEHADLFDALQQDLVARLLATDRLMPYVDYFQSREDGQWYRTGYDGERYYITETERPRWARRGQQRGRWYDFR